jgi:tetratricopeptide (TPR) repeat protein
MKRPQLISQGSLNRMLQEANAAWQRRDFQQSFELMERASRLDPANPRLLLQVGQWYGRRYEYAAAERSFEKAARVASNKAETLTLAGRMLTDFARHDRAEHFLLKASQQPDAGPDDFARLAEFYERSRRPDDAAAMADRALRLDQVCPIARITLSKLRVQTGKLEEAEQVLRPALATTSREMQIRSFYQLGAILDRQGRYDEAMAAFMEAKTGARPDAPPILAQLQPIIKHLHEMRDNVSAELFARWSESNQELAPLHRMAFLGGHARSGTTLLEQVLDSHPDIVSTDESTVFHEEAYATLQQKTSHQVSISMLAGLDAASVQTLRQARESYFRAMTLWLGRPPGDRLMIDKNPSLQALFITFIRIFPEARLLVALRDPRDVVLSCFMLPHYPLQTGNVTFLELESTVRTYTRIMGIWQTLKPLIKNPYLEVRYEDMVADLESVARKTLDFLGVPWDAHVLDFHEHARQKRVSSPTYADVTQPVYKRAQGRWRKYENYLAPYLDKLEPFVKAFGYE